jgi:hypothetical protein
MDAIRFVGRLQFRLPIASYLLTEFSPRLSLVIVVELFAYFFLGLYKSNLQEIKYFQRHSTRRWQLEMTILGSKYS